MKHNFKKAMSLVLALALVVSVAIPAFAYSSSGNTNIATWSFYRSGGKINVTAGTHASYANSVDLEVKVWNNGIEVSHFGAVGTTSVSKSDWVYDKGGNYTAYYLGQIYYGPNDKYHDFCQIDDSIAPLYLLRSGTTNQVDAFITQLGSKIVKEFGYDISEYHEINITAKDVPEAIVNYFFHGLQTGIGSSKPAVFTNKDQNQYLFAFQDANGQDILKQVDLSAAQNVVSVVGYEKQSQKILMGQAITE